MSIPINSLTCTKSFEGFPCCHRQWKHEGHCKYVHGYSRTFTFWFKANELDFNGFIVDFSSLDILKQKLLDNFDHTFLVNSDDPLLNQWQELHIAGALNLRIMENIGMEYTSNIIWEWANSILLKRDKGRTCCVAAESRENNFNAARFEKIPDWFNLK